MNLKERILRDLRKTVNELLTNSYRFLVEVDQYLGIFTSIYSHLSNFVHNGLHVLSIKLSMFTVLSCLI